jgi:hypothetical protein
MEVVAQQADGVERFRETLEVQGVSSCKMLDDAEQQTGQAALVTGEIMSAAAANCTITDPIPNPPCLLTCTRWIRKTIPAEYATKAPSRR